MRRLAINFLLGSALAAGLLWFVQAELLTEVAREGESGWAALWEAMGSVSVGSLAAFAVVFLLVHIVRTVRWVYQVKPLGERDTAKVFAVCAVGYAAIVIFPFRLGELVRPYLLARESDVVTFPEAMGTAVVERIVDGLFITGLLFLAVATAPLEGSATVRNAGWVSLGVFSSAAFGLVLFAWQRRVAHALLEWTFGLVDAAARRVLGRDPGLVHKVESLIEGFFAGIRSLRAEGALAGFLGLTVLYWALDAVSIWMLARAYGIDISLLDGFGVLAVLVVGIMIPSGPGLLGTFQVFLNEGLKLYIPTVAIGAVALAFALVMNIVQLVLQVGFAFPFLRRAGVSAGGLLALQQEAARGAGAEAEVDSSAVG